MKCNICKNGFYTRRFWQLLFNKSQLTGTKHFNIITVKTRFNELFFCFPVQLQFFYMHYFFYITNPLYSKPSIKWTILNNQFFILFLLFLILKLVFFSKKTKFYVSILKYKCFNTKFRLKVFPNLFHGFSL